MQKQTFTDKQIIQRILTIQNNLIQIMDNTLPIVESLNQTKIDYPNDAKQMHYVAMIEVMRQAAMEHCLTCLLMDAFAFSNDGDQLTRIVKIIDPVLLKPVQDIFRDYKNTNIEAALQCFLKLASLKKKSTWLETYMKTEVFNRLSAFATEEESLQHGYFSSVMH